MATLSNGVTNRAVNGPGDKTISASEWSSIRDLVDYLTSQKYRFLCPTPETHTRYISSRKGSQTKASTLTDIFGWSLPVEKSVLQSLLPSSIDSDSLFEPADDGLVKATVRVTSLNFNGPWQTYPRDESKTSVDLYVHSSYPCRGTGRVGVFCGPDTYRFLAYLASPSVRSLIEESVKVVKSRSPSNTASGVDLGCGPGAGALGIQRQYGGIFSSVYGLDINPYAVAFSEINAKACATKKASNPNAALHFKESSFFSAIENVKDLALVVSDPPYIPTATATGVYCDGGDDGMAFAIDVIDKSLELLVPGGLVIMHTGVCVAGDNPGRDGLLERCEELQRDGKVEICQYVLIDNDVFGDEVGQDPQGRLGWIQVVGLVLRKI